MTTRSTDDEICLGTTGRWKGKRLLTKAEKLERRRAQSQRWRERNRKKLLEYFREYRLAHPELKDWFKSYYRKNVDKWKARPPQDPALRRARNATKRDHINAVRRAWDKKNPERARAIELRRREKGREKKRLADRLYRQQKPETYKASIARAKAAKPELYKQLSVKSSLIRRARKKALPVERVSLKRIVERDRGLCHLCSDHVERRDRSFDHLIPVVRGGAHAEWNLMLAHLTCNKRRATKQILPEETKAAAAAYIAKRQSERAA